MSQIILPAAMGEIVGQTVLFSFGMVTGLVGKLNSDLFNCT